jgi:hypothetical protein
MRTTVVDSCTNTAKSVYLPSIFFNCVNRHNYKLPGKEVEDATEYESDKGASEDDDIIRHAEVGSRQVDKERGSVDAANCDSIRSTITIVSQRGDDSRRQIPPALGVRRMFGISEK